MLARAYERKRGSNDGLFLTCHASAVIDDQTNGRRCIFGLENLDLLFTAVFVDMEIGCCESRYRPVSRVQHGYVEYCKVDIDG